MPARRPRILGHSTRRTQRPEDYVDEIIETARALLADNASIGDLKIATRTLREMRDAFRVFSNFQHVHKVSTFGSARVLPGDPTFRLAENFTRRIADHGFMVITGGGPGIMEACQKGAGRERSFGMNIRLPFEQAANPVIEGDPKLLVFNYFFTRKLFFVKEAHALVLFPGGFGTHDEGFEALTLLQTGKSKPMPVVFLDIPGGKYWKTWQQYVEDHLLRGGMISEEDLSLFKVTDDVDTAVSEIVSFYRVYHSSRYVGERFVLRLQQVISGPLLERINTEFADITGATRIEQRGPLAAERDEPELEHLPRLVMRFNRINFGRLRMLIDMINRG